MVVLLRIGYAPTVGRPRHAPCAPTSNRRQAPCARRRATRRSSRAHRAALRGARAGGGRTAGAADPRAEAARAAGLPAPAPGPPPAGGGWRRGSGPTCWTPARGPRCAARCGRSLGPGDGRRRAVPGGRPHDGRRSRPSCRATSTPSGSRRWCARRAPTRWRGPSGSRRGPLVADLTEEWALEAQDRARDQVADALVALADAAEAAGDLPRAAIGLDPAGGARRPAARASHRALMRRLAAPGRRPRRWPRTGAAARSWPTSSASRPPPRRARWPTRCGPARRRPPPRPPRRRTAARRARGAAALGRDAELALLAAAWAAAVAGAAAWPSCTAPRASARPAWPPRSPPWPPPRAPWSPQGAAIDVGGGPPLRAVERAGARSRARDARPAGRATLAGRPRAPLPGRGAGVGAARGRAGAAGRRARPARRGRRRGRGLGARASGPVLLVLEDLHARRGREPGVPGLRRAAACAASARWLLVTGAAGRRGAGSAVLRRAARARRRARRGASSGLRGRADVRRDRAAGRAGAGRRGGRRGRAGRRGQPAAGPRGGPRRAAAATDGGPRARRRGCAGAWPGCTARRACSSTCGRRRDGR